MAYRFFKLDNSAYSQYYQVVNVSLGLNFFLRTLLSNFSCTGKAE